MPCPTAIICQISGGAQKNSGHMHQLAHGKIRRQEADKKYVDVKKQTDPLREPRMKAQHRHNPFLDVDEIHPVNKAHENA